MTGRRAKIGDAVLAIALVAATVLVGLWGPGGITEALVAVLGLDLAPQATLRKTVAASPEERILLESVVEAEVAATLAQLASSPSRLPGYAGHEDAAKYIQSEFHRLGLSEISVDTFKVTVPVDRGAHLTVVPGGERMRLYGLWPNHVRPPTTPAGGVSGPLVDGGLGSLSDLNGQVVDGSIVLVGFGCGMDYLSARGLGVAAFIFYDDGGVTREQAMDKFLRVPVDVPRFWIDRGDAVTLLGRLRSGRLTVRVQGRMDWDTVPAYNILGYLPGSDEERPGGFSRRWRDDLIVISAYYDAMSVVPALAPGAESACGITALLHLARLLRERPPHYSVLFLATSGHFEGMEGVNAFLYNHSRKSDYFRSRIEEPIDLSLFIGLDLSTRNDQVAAFSQGTFYTGWGTNGYLKNLLTPYVRRFGEHVAAVYGEEAGRPRFVNAVSPSKKNWKDFMPVGLALEAEAPVFAGLRAVSLATPNDLRRLVDTPLDRVEQVNARALTRQIRTIGALLFGALRDPGLIRESALQLKDQGHSLSGNVYWFNREVHFAVPKDPIAGALVTYWQSTLKSVAGVRTLMVTETDSSGHFRYDILRNAKANRVLAYKLGEAGQITWAPDLGTEGAAAFPVEQKYVWWEDEMVQVLFPCRALELFDIVDARQLVALDKPTILGVNDAPLQWFGEDHVVNQSLSEGKVGLAAAVYARPGTRVKVLMGTGLLGVKYLLTNAPPELLAQPVPYSEATPELLESAKGTGYLVDAGLLTHPLLRSTSDMWVIDDVRMKILQRYGIRNERVVRLHDQARQYLTEAKESLEALNYEGFVAAMRRAAGYESRAYPDVKATASDTVNGIVFYFVLLLPFSFFIERLLFGFADIRSQVAGFAGVFLLVFLILHQVHPAFKLSSSPYIILLAFVILAMGMAVIVLILSKFKVEMQKAKRRDSGLYESDVGRLSATMAAVLLGISNLRKRKLRTGLTAATLVLLSFTALSFTSISTSIEFYRLPRGETAPYQGALVRDRNWRGMQPVVLDYVRSAFGDRGLTSPRSWFLLPEGKGRSSIHFASLESDRESNAYGLVGMGWAEPRVTGIDRFLLPGGRWFEPGERRVCALPADMASLVGIDPGDVGRARIRLLGADYTVIGLIDAEGLGR
ncbi:M28 family peptidase, partial [Candidatus Latescibacterota bacterium]